MPVYSAIVHDLANNLVCVVWSPRCMARVGGRGVLWSTILFADPDPQRIRGIILHCPVHSVERRLFTGPVLGQNIWGPGPSLVGGVA